MKLWKVVAPAVVVTGLGAGLALGAIPNPDGSLSMCYGNPAGAARPGPLYPADSGTACPSGETRVTVGQTGPAGARGAAGDAGPTGPAGGTAAGPPSVYERLLNTGVQLVHNGAGTPRTVTLSLPRGTFTVDTAATLAGSNFIEVSTGPDRKEFRPYPLSASCVLASPGRTSASAGSGPDGQGDFMVTDHATIALDQPGSVSLKCQSASSLTGPQAELGGTLRLSAVQISGDPAQVSVQGGTLANGALTGAQAVTHGISKKLGAGDAATNRKLDKILKALDRIG